MIVVSLLATSALITLARASPMPYGSYGRVELPVEYPVEYPVYYDPDPVVRYNERSLKSTGPSIRFPDDIIRDYAMDNLLPDDITDVGYDTSSNLARFKKHTMSGPSLSINNPIDVLRQRVLFQIARNLASKNQRQIHTNRHILKNVGKRSTPDVDPGYPITSGSSHNDNNRVYTNDHETENQPQAHPYTQRIPIDGAHEWYNVDDSVIRGGSSSSSNSNSNSNSGDDETRKVLFNYNHDRI